ncbi:hypothetical protein [Histidinibacterium lentulum]|nr:hypothetical protein [Histidinibacterium lentulum]
MKPFALAAALLLASGVASHAEGQAETQPRPEMIQRQTMGGSFPLEMVVTAVVIAIIAAAIDGN